MGAVLDKLIVLGGGGWFPANGRHTACALLRDRDGAILIDAGTGVSRLVENPDLLAGVERLDILLTHFHLDHVVGLAYLPALGLPNRITVWGPGRTLYGSSTQELLTSMFHEPMHSVSLERQGIEIRDLPLGESELAGVQIDTRRQDLHSAPSLGYRFGTRGLVHERRAAQPRRSQLGGPGGRHRPARRGRAAAAHPHAAV